MTFIAILLPFVAWDQETMGKTTLYIQKIIRWFYEFHRIDIHLINRIIYARNNVIIQTFIIMVSKPITLFHFLRAMQPQLETTKNKAIGCKCQRFWD